MDYLDPQTDDPDGGALSLLSTRHRKKQAEHDSQLLANRIALLKKEEERALKKIEKTKQRALELISMRHESEKRLQERVLNSEKAARAQKKAPGGDTGAREARGHEQADEGGEGGTEEDRGGAEG